MLYFFLNRIPTMRNPYYSLFISIVWRGDYRIWRRFLRSFFSLLFQLLRISFVAKHFVEIETGVVGRYIITFISSCMRSYPFVYLLQFEFSWRLFLLGSFKIKVVKVDFVLELNMVCKLVLAVKHFFVNRTLQYLLELICTFRTNYV